MSEEWQEFNGQHSNPGQINLSNSPCEFKGWADFLALAA